MSYNLMYLEDYCESLETLCPFLKKSIVDIRRTDLGYSNGFSNLQKAARGFFETASKTAKYNDPSTREREMKKLRDEFTSLERQAKDKIEMARTTTEELDKHLAILDKILDLFRKKLEEKTPGITSTLEDKSLLLDNPPEQPESSTRLNPPPRRKRANEEDFFTGIVQKEEAPPPEKKRKAGNGLMPAQPTSSNSHKKKSHSALRGGWNGYPGLREDPSLLTEGAQVIASLQAGEASWVVMTIRRITKGKIVVMDIDSDVDQEYVLNRKSVIGLPPPAKPGDERYFYTPGHKVLALYPQTTCFYNATVVQSPPKKWNAATPDACKFKLHFEDDDHEDGTVRYQFVLAHHVVHNPLQ